MDAMILAWVKCAFNRLGPCFIYALGSEVTGSKFQVCSSDISGKVEQLALQFYKELRDKFKQEVVTESVAGPEPGSISLF